MHRCKALVLIAALALGTLHGCARETLELPCGLDAAKDCRVKVLKPNPLWP